jgi:ABC-2 type transport system permease protein
MRPGRRFAALLRKELLQFFRDRVMLFIVVYLFTGEVLMCVNALSLDVRDLPTAVADFDRSSASRELIERLRASGYFRIDHGTTREAELARLLDRGDALAAVVIPPEFSSRLAAGKPTAVQVLLDGTNSNTASVAQGYSTRIVQSYALERVRSAAPEFRMPVEHRSRIWYNAELDYRYHMMLSMLALAGMMVGVTTAAAGIVREKESGTIEQMMVTPITPAELVLAKMTPPFLAGMASLVPALVIAWAIGVPMRGGLALFLLLSAMFLVSSMAIGIMIATVTETLQQALLVSFFALFPILFLSGTLVPVETMPVALRYLAEASPLTHYFKALLGVFLKGVGLEILWREALALIAISAVLLGASLLRLRRRI